MSKKTDEPNVSCQLVGAYLCCRDGNSSLEHIIQKPILDVYMKNLRPVIRTWLSLSYNMQMNNRTLCIHRRLLYPKFSSMNVCFNGPAVGLHCATEAVECVCVNVTLCLVCVVFFCISCAALCLESLNKRVYA